MILGETWPSSECIDANANLCLSKIGFLTTLIVERPKLYFDKCNYWNYLKYLNTGCFPIELDFFFSECLVWSSLRVFAAVSALCKLSEDITNAQVTIYMVKET